MKLLQLQQKTEDATGRSSDEEDDAEEEAMAMIEDTTEVRGTLMQLQ